MELTRRGSVWRVAGRSVRGVQHALRDQPNQDAVGWSPVDVAGPPLVLALADGHGSPKCFRSDIGARLAVAAALTVLGELLHAENLLGPSISQVTLERLVQERLARELVMRWRAGVEQDLSQRGPPEISCENPYLPYGATLLALALGDTFLLYFQIGDGDILVVQPDGETARPAPRDARLFANETTSLAGEEAWQDVRVTWQSLARPAPALICVATDGYANSFRSEEDFVRIGPDLLELIRTAGFESVTASLEGWLTEASRSGSGDDISLGLVYREASPA